MREIRSSGSEGGVADSGHPYPYRLQGNGRWDTVPTDCRYPPSWPSRSARREGLLQKGPCHFH